MQSAMTAEKLESATERRSGARHVAVILIAKLTVGSVHSVCRIRNISISGALLELSHVIAPGQKVLLELRSDLVVSGKIVWTKNGHSGVQFDNHIDVSQYLSRTESRLNRIKVRAPRYRCTADALLEHNGQMFACTLFDIAMSGARLCNLPAELTLKRGHPVKLMRDSMPSRNAIVVWTDKHSAGIKFHQPLKYGQLEDWLSENWR